MANCSFLKATDARNRARNDTLIWTEICGVQSAILAAIDNDEYSTIVNSGTPFTATGSITAVTVTNGGTLYDNIDAVGLTGVNPANGATYTDGIFANGTAGTGAAITPVVTGQTITSVTIDNGGTGYDPISASATVGVLYELSPASQDETDFDNAGNNGSFDGGNFYAVTDVITLSEASTVTVDTIDASGGRARTIISQTEADFDDAIASTENGTFNGGNANSLTGYLAGQTITLNDGTQILVDNVDGNGDVTEFTITRTSQSSIPVDSTLVQVSVDSGPGQGFTLTTDGNNETPVGVITEFTLSASSVPFRYPAVLTQDALAASPATTTALGEGFTLSPNTNNAQPVTTGSGAILTPIVTNGVITNVVINNGGSLYVGQEPIIFSHPSGTGATAFVSSVVGGEIRGITIVTGGSGYEVANALIEVSHPTGTGFVGVVNTTGGVITSISVQEGGALYGTIRPTAVVTTSTGSGATFQVNLTGTPDGSVDTIDVLTQGSNYASGDTIAIVPTSGDDGSGATATLTLDANTFGTDATLYYSVLSGQSSNTVISDQIQYVLDYFDALGYNIRAQVNPATGDTMQWQIIW